MSFLNLNKMQQYLLSRRTEGYAEDLEQEVRDYCCSITRIREAFAEYDAGMKAIKHDCKMRPIVAKEHERRLARSLLIKVKKHSEVDDS